MDKVTTKGGTITIRVDAGGGMRLVGQWSMGAWIVDLDIPYTTDFDFVTSLRKVADGLEKQGYGP